MNIAIFHGTEGSPDGNWFPWLKQNLGSTHHITIPTLPTPNGQTVANWIDATTTQIPNLDQYDVLIGHSCGASFLPHLILDQTLKPKTVVMVAAFSAELGFPNYDTLLQTFYLPDSFLKEARTYFNRNQIKPILFHGDNDPYIPLSQAQHIAAQLTAPLYIIKNGGHLNTEFGYTQFPDLIDVINA
jgi:uncharacterized protein